MLLSAKTATVLGSHPVRHAVARPSRLWGHALLHLSAVAWVCLDWALVIFATYIAYHLMVFDNPAFGWVVSPWFSTTAFCVCLVVAGMIFGLYERQTLLSRSRILVRTALTLGLGSVLAYATIYVAFYAESSRWIGLSVVLTHVLIATPARLAAHHLITGYRMNVLCVGTADSVRKVVSLLRSGFRGRYHIVGHLLVPQVANEPRTRSRGGLTPGVASNRWFPHVCPCIGAIEEIDSILKSRAIDQVVVDPELVSHPAVDAAILSCLENGCRVTDQPTFAEKLLGEVPAEAISTRWFVLADVTTGGGYDAAKRIIDVGAALLGLALTLPFWPIVAVLIHLDSRGSALYKQQRVGRHGRIFTIYKFRTMREDAERDGARWATQYDSRVTRVGQFLRHLRLDELPQFWNILRGDMSLVGPRPERPEFVEQLAQDVPHYRQRHLIKPGLTGWAQINYQYGASAEDAHRKLCYDLYYLKHRSIDLDTAIIIRTLGTFLLGAH